METLASAVGAAPLEVVRFGLERKDAAGGVPQRMEKLCLIRPGVGRTT